VSDNPFGDVPKAIMWLACPPLLVGKISNEGYITMSNGQIVEKHHFNIDCLEESVSIGEGNANCPIYILRVFDNEELLLKRTNEPQGEYKRIGVWRPEYKAMSSSSWFLIWQNYKDRRNHAKKDAYVPMEKHNLGINRLVITLVWSSIGLELVEESES